MTCGIYRIANLIVGRRYFGQSIALNKREGHHFSTLKRGTHHNTHLQRAWKKYGEDAFEFVVMLECEPFELTEYEQYFVDAYPPEKLYNICLKCVDSCKGIIRSAEARARMSVVQKGELGNNFGKHHSDETRAKISSANKGELSHSFGKHHSEETREKNSKANSGELNHNFGKHFSSKVCAKMSEAQKGKHPSEKSKQKMSESAKGNNNALGCNRTEEVRQKLSDGMNRYYEEHPEKRQQIAERTKKYYADKKVARQTICDMLKQYYILPLSEGGVN